MNILHISDVHFGMSDLRGEQPRITDAIIDAVHRDGLKPDLTLITGDVAHSGEPEQFNVGLDWIERLTTKLETTLFILPGNHDIRRADALTPVLREVSKRPEIYDSWRQTAKAYCGHLSNFFDFHSSVRNALPKKLKGDWETQYFGFSESININGVAVHVVCLNSALFSCDNADEGNLIIDIKTLNSHLNQLRHRGGLLIAACHHPLSFLSEWNRKDVEEALTQEAGAHILLHGHLHDQNANSSFDSTGRKLSILAAGAAYQGTNWPQSFTYHTLDFGNQRIITQTYEYIQTSGRWIIDQGRSVEIPAALPKAEALLKSPTPSDSKDVGMGANIVVSYVSEIGAKRDGQAPSTSDSTNASETIDVTGVEVSVNDNEIDDEVKAHLAAAAAIQEKLLPYFYQSPDISKYCYAIRHRIKHHDRIKQKILSRRNAGLSYDIKTVSDICGFRVVTYYQSQIPIVLENILLAIKSDHSVSSVILQTRTVGIDVNTNLTDDDPLSILQDIRNVVKRVGLGEVERKSRVTGYSSVHLIVSAKCFPPHDDLIGEMQIEIQIRSALEDVWSVIDTELRYGKARGEVGLSWTRHLNVFKHSIDALVQYVDLIKKHSEEEPLMPPSEAQITQTIHPKETQLARLSRLPAPAYERVSQAYKLWDEAEIARLAGSDPGLRRQVADTFSAILNEYRNKIDDPGLLEELTYAVEAESAYMLMYTGDVDDLSQAEQYYYSILSKPDRYDDATALFRLATVYLRQGRYEEAIKSQTSVLENIEANKYNYVNKSHWVYDRVRLGIAYTYWKMSKEDGPDDATKISYITNSYDYALSVINYPAIQGAEGRVHAINDLLSYAYAAAKIEDNWITSKLNAAAFQSYISEIERYIKDNPSCRLDYIDTMLHIVESKCEKALPLALRIRGEYHALVSKRRPKLKYERVGTAKWQMEIYRGLEDDEGESFAFAEDIIKRCAHKV